MKNLLLRYGLLKRFRRGICLTIIPSWACNLHCEYCGLEIGTPCLPKNPKTVFSTEQWIAFIKTFPLRIREIFISGGEPSLSKTGMELAKWVIENGYFLTIYSNLTNTNLYELPRSIRFRIMASNHHRFFDQEKFLENVNFVRQRHRIDIDKVGNTPDFVGRGKPLSDDEIHRKIKKGYLRCAPDGLIFTNCYDMCEQYKTGNSD